ncbi:MAG TPA: TetR/AcrR family transcriptional regulator [Candidatus Angelobacter sp.]|jgi:AcrR family transcriptional regulator|nr:TetR/AcrR family transcriptional regulator [Candidatus Angelobacter sp.]
MPVRLARAHRREALLDAAAALIVADGVEAVSMESVADHAGVSRPLVYKHFANRGEMLTAVYGREAVILHSELAAKVRAATDLEDMYRTLVRAALRASSERGQLFRALRSAGAWNPDLRREQEERDRATVRIFAEHASAEFGIPAVEAESATAMLLTALDSVLGQFRTRRPHVSAALLEETYLDLIVGGLEHLAARTHTTRRRGRAAGASR